MSVERGLWTGIIALLAWLWLDKDDRCSRLASAVDATTRGVMTDTEMGRFYRRLNQEWER